MSASKQAVFGIDLGTTYSVAAYVDDVGRPTVVRNAYGHDTTASVVHFESDTNVVVGHVAKESAVLAPDEVVSLVKRQMGNKDYSQTFFGKQHSAPAISALILQALARDIETEGYQVSSVVITVPAYFGMLEKEATRQAGELAGLNVAGIVPEPVAAALSYGLGGAADGTTVMVYDLGGGTFDVTVMRIGETKIEVLAVGGNHDLGGANWDEVLFNHFLDEASAQAGDDSVRDDEQTVQEVWNLAEKTKKDLSSAESRTVLIRHAGGSAKITVTRAQFEQMTAHLVQQTIDITQRTLDEAEALHPGVQQEISRVLLVGGSCWMPAIPAAVRSAFSWEVELADPDLSVAKGAALFAAGKVVREIVEQGEGTAAADQPISVDDLDSGQKAELERKVGLLPDAAVQLGNRTVVNVLPKAVGIKLVDETVPNWDQLDPLPYYIEHLVQAQTQVPFIPEEPFAGGTLSANQDVVRIEIWEQAGASAGRALHENTLLRFGELSGLSPYGLPAGSPIAIYFNVDGEGLVRVTAKEPNSGRDIEVEAKIQLLTDEQMDEARANLSGLTART